ncbi:MAG: WD40/YVTN/BNR-like repeat-containing protein [Bryobacteraceae bacterium]
MRVRLFLFALLCLSQVGFSQVDEKLLKGMQYRLIGPFRGGRVLAVAGIAGDPQTYYFGGASGGVWKSIDGGAHWAPLFDKEAVSSIGSIAIAPSDPNIVYVGTGEGCLRGDLSYGDGIYRSNDGGKTWKNLGLRDSRHIPTVLVDPRNPEIVLAAAMGHAFAPSAERGVYRSTDGGKTWAKVLYVDDRTGATDIAFAPSNPNIVFAAMYQVERQPWTFTSGGPGSGLYRSTDGGATWSHLEGNGLPQGILGRIGVSVSGADPNRVYALIEAEKGGLYRSDDGGDKWEPVNGDERYRQRAWYFSHVFADPKDPDTVYVLNTGMFRSTDAGKTFTLLPAPHGDHHGLWIDPANPQRMINGDDGGATITIDGGKNWTPQMNQPTAQFYHVTTDNRFPYYVFGAQQDNTPVATASWSDSGLIGTQDWYVVAGSESAFMAADPRDGNIVYSAGQGVARFDKHNDQGLDISPWPVDFAGHGAGDFPHRLQWTEPILFSPHDPNVIYTAGEVVFKTTNEGKSWTIISPDLTRNDKSKQKASGGPITEDNTSVEYYDTIFALAESPVENGLLWAGSDDGLIHITRNGGGSWQNVTPPSMPEWGLVSLIDPSPHSAGTAYVAVDRHKLDDFKAYIFKTADYGKTWAEIAAGIPEGDYVHAVREDPKRKGLLYAGTETGVWVSFDDGAHWQKLRLNLPTVPVHDLVIKDDDLVVATHGRAFWILDDLTPLRQMAPTDVDAAAKLFAPRPAYRLRFPDSLDRRQPAGENPPPGAVLYYYLKSAPKQPIKLEILDAQGNVVKTYSSAKKEEDLGPAEWPDVQRVSEVLPAEAGLNRFFWNLRYEDPVKVPGAFYESDIAPKGPMALPGAYQVRLTAGGQSQTAHLELREDPRIHVSLADLEKQADLEKRIAQSLTSLHRTVNEIRDLRAQLTALDRHYKNAPEWQPLKPVAADLLSKIASVEGKIMQVKMKSTEGDLRYPTMIDEQLISLNWSVDSSDAAPTEGQQQLFAKLSAGLQEELDVWNQILSQDLTRFNRAAEKQKISLVDVKTRQ